MTREQLEQLSDEPGLSVNVDEMRKLLTEHEWVYGQNKKKSRSGAALPHP